MAKYLTVILKVPLTPAQAEVISEVTKSEFAVTEWNQMILSAIRSSALNENITVTHTEIVNDSDGFVVPEEKVEVLL